MPSHSQFQPRRVTSGYVHSPELHKGSPTKNNGKPIQLFARRDEVCPHVAKVLGYHEGDAEF